MIETGETTATLTVVESLMRAELYDLNGGLIVGKLDVLDLTRNQD